MSHCFLYLSPHSPSTRGFVSDWRSGNLGESFSTGQLTMTTIQTRPWVGEARQALQKISKRPRGEWEQELQKLAAPRSAQTLRRAILAVEFLAKLKRERLFPAERLETFPVAAIEHLIRWYGRNPKAALKAAHDLLSGVYTAKTLGEAEQDSRTAIFEGAGKALEANYRRKIEEQIELIANSLGNVTRAKEGDLSSLSYHIRRAIDFGFLDSSGHFLGGFIIAGPYNDKDLYARRAFDWVSKANTLLKICEYVFLIVPENGDKKAFLHLQQQLGISPDRLRIMTIFLNSGVPCNNR